MKKNRFISIKTTVIKLLRNDEKPYGNGAVHVVTIMDISMVTIQTLDA